jgi:hypothetical protein
MGAGHVDYHEAGHAVIAHAELLVPKVASIVPDADGLTLGHAEYARRFRIRPDLSPHRAVRLRFEPRILTCFAGVIAERKASGGRRHNWIGAQWDLDLATEMLMYGAGSDRQLQALSKYLWVTAEDAVEIHWREIEQVAAALREHGTLDAEGIDRAILGPAWRPLRVGGLTA